MYSLRHVDGHCGVHFAIGIPQENACASRMHKHRRAVAWTEAMSRTACGLCAPQPLSVAGGSPACRTYSPGCLSCALDVPPWKRLTLALLATDSLCARRRRALRSCNSAFRTRQRRTIRRGLNIALVEPRRRLHRREAKCVGSSAPRFSRPLSWQTATPSTRHGAA